MAAFLRDAQTTMTCPDNWQHAALRGLGGWFRPILPMVQVGLCRAVCSVINFASERLLSLLPQADTQRALHSSGAEAVA